jgi:hypothetical protein
MGSCGHNHHDNRPWGSKGDFAAVITIANPFRAMAIAPPVVAEDSEFWLVGGSRPNNR